MNGDRSGLLSAGGVLCIVVGAFEVVAGAMLEVVTILGSWPLWFSLCPRLPGLETPANQATGPLAFCAVTPWHMAILGGILVVLGIIAIAGGVSAIRRRSFGLALAGAICTLPSVILGILALIFISLGRDEFEAV